MQEGIALLSYAQIDPAGEPKKLTKQRRVPSTLIAPMGGITLVNELPQLRPKPRCIVLARVNFFKGANSLMANCKLLFRFCKAPSKLDSTESASAQLQRLSRSLSMAGHVLL